jgi:hypothetical protein
MGEEGGGGAPPWGDVWWAPPPPHAGDRMCGSSQSIHHLLVALGPNADYSMFSHVARRWPLRIRHARKSGSTSLVNEPPAAAICAVVARSSEVRALSLLR